jgi:hypothetical protein
MADYTPTEEQVRNVWGGFRVNAGMSYGYADAEFNRFIASVKTAALREAAENWRNNGWGHTAVTWLDDRADTIEKGAGE